MGFFFFQTTIPFPVFFFFFFQISRLEEKDCAREAAEEEVRHLRREILLMGEMQQKYR